MNMICRQGSLIATKQNFVLCEDKSDGLHKVLKYVNEVHSLCGVPGIDFAKTVNGIHPSLHQNGVEQSKNISNGTLEGLASTIANLKAQRKSRISQDKRHNGIIMSPLEVNGLFRRGEETIRWKLRLRGTIDPSGLLANIESQILKAKEDSLSRKDSMDRINKWIATCDEEAWLEEYNQDSKRYSSGRDAHVNLKRAEKARILVTKIPGFIYEA